MKAFKKWFNEYFRPICFNQQDKDRIYFTWQAALKEVLKRFEISHSKSCIIDWIKKELKE